MKETPVLVLMCAGLATRWSRIGTAESIDTKIQEGTTIRVRGNRISGYVPDQDEGTTLLSSDKEYVIKGEPGKLTVCDPDRVKNLAQAFEGGPRLIEYDMAEFYNGGGKEVVLVVNQKNKHYFEKVFRKDSGNVEYNGLKIHYVYQSPNQNAIPRGTVEALVAAYEIVSGRCFIGCNGDDIYPGGFTELLKPQNKPRDNTEIVTLGYQLGRVIPKDSDGHTIGIFKVDANNILTECVEYDKLVWTSDNKIQDKVTQEVFEPTVGASMNIMCIPPGAYERMKMAHLSMPYKNIGMMKTWFRGRTEFLTPNFLGMVPGMDNISCRVIPFDAERYGLTSKADLPPFREAVIKVYHRGNMHRPIW